MSKTNPTEKKHKKVYDTFDYQTICTKDTTLKERRNLHIGDIWNNSVKCNNCGDIIRSKNIHNFVTCACGSISIDGGSWYCKRSGELGGYIELSEPFSDYKAEGGLE